MIPLSDAARGVLERSHVRRVRVESWRGGELLAADVPVDAGTEEVDRTLRVPERVTLAVPRRWRGEDWSPGVDPLHPLAANGQRLRVELGIGVAGGDVEWIQRGWFLVHESDPNGDQVDVTAVGLLQLVEEARLVAPFQPTGTMLATLRSLVEPALTVVLDPALPDQPVPAGATYDDDRLAAVVELLDAWAADAHVTEDGYLAVYPAVLADLTPTPAMGLRSTGVGTVIRAGGASRRDGAVNVEVVRGTAADGSQVQGVAYDSQGAQGYPGPFNPLPVPEFWESPLITSPVQAYAAALTRLARRRRSTAREVAVTMVPHPGLQSGDVVDVQAPGLDGTYTVEHLSLPYTAAGGAQTLRVRGLT